ncbi:HAMP domain-containing histidine kinase [Puteibacter caeruleilacunae]|nr:HAMP domain-containing histidine kinase [Puteibacter caeruleilacunae]
MNLYFKKRWWKIFLLSGAIIIGSISIIVTNVIVDGIEKEERKKVEMWAEATRMITQNDLSGVNLTFIYEIIQKNESIPLIVINQDGKITAHRNLQLEEPIIDENLYKHLEKIRNQYPPIEYKVSETETHKVYYSDSALLIQLRYFPLIQVAVIFVFIIIAYLAFDSSRRAEQNQVWVGMAKETAHQLGTPISSLMAWVELIKLQEPESEIVKELDKDTTRLQKIADRFSKIGSTPRLEMENLDDLITNVVDYLKTRVSDKIEFKTHSFSPNPVFAPLNLSLFEWVIENICKNAIDAMNGDGQISLEVSSSNDHYFLDITDNGKGIAKSKFKTIFKPGYTTKKRGWGLGLSLVKRIVENYHSGKIFVKWSELNKGTTFRIVLKKKLL